MKSKKPSHKQSQKAIAQIKKIITESGKPESFVALGEAAQLVIDDKSNWPEFAEFVDADPTGPVDYQMLAQYVTFGKVAEQMTGATAVAPDDVTI